MRRVESAESPSVRVAVTIRSPAGRSWASLLAGAPPTTCVAERAGGELVLHSGAESVTGLRLSRGGGTYAIAVPAFAHASEMWLARGLTAQVAAAVGGAIEIADAIVPASELDSAFEHRVARPLVDRSVEVFRAMLDAPPAAVFVVEGYRRPYHLGRETARRIATLAATADGDAYARLGQVVASIQELTAPTVFPEPLRVRTPDGATGVYARWTPEEETLLPPCDFLLVTDADGVAIRVGAALVAEVVGPHGARIDERQWLLGALGPNDAARVRERARAAGRRMKLPAA